MSIDPRWNIAIEELVKQFNSAMIVKDMINESQEKLNEIRNISNQINTFINLTKEKDFHQEIKESGNNIITKLKKIEENLYQDKIETSQDEINYPRKWMNHITHLYDRITTDDQEPNDGMINRLNELQNDYKKYIEPYKEILDNDLKDFSRILSANGVKGIIIN